MSQVSVSIGGRAYRLACNPGEEPHLESLARDLDEKIKSMRSNFGEIGDQRLTVMAALMVGDEASETRRKAEEAATAADAALMAERGARTAAERRAEALVQDMDEMSHRIERLASTLAGAGR